MIQVFDNPNAYFTTNTNQSTILNPSIEITDGSIGGYNYSWDFGDNSSIFGTINDVINHLCHKLVHSHPHIYGNVKVQDDQEVKKNWEKLKMQEGKTSVLEGVPKSLPAIVKAFRIQEKVRGIGFDLENKNQVWDKVLEEIDELKVEISNANQERIEQEFGDVLFALTNYSRFINVNPEDALERTNKRFVKRFQIMEKIIRDEGLDLSEMNLSEMDVFWKKAKDIYSFSKKKD